MIGHHFKYKGSVPVTAVRSFFVLVLSLTAALFLGGCGRMGDPIPPGMALLSPADAPSIVGSLEGATLSWTPPRKTVGGESTPEPSGYLIERSVWLPGKADCDECAQSTEVVAMIDAEKLKLEGKSPERWTDRALKPGYTYGYRVYSIDSSGRPGEPSPISKLAWLTVSPPQVTAKPGDAQALITFTAPKNSPPGTTPKGLAVYDENGGLALQLPANTTEGILTGLVNNKRHILSARWVVDTSQGWRLQSEPVYFTVTPSDMTSPEPPREVVAFGGREGIRLNWLPARGERYEALIIERRETDKDSWAELARVSGVEVGYYDYETVEGSYYSYRLFSVDEVGNRSKPSPVATAKRLRKRTTLE